MLTTLPVVALYDAPEPDVVLEERISDASVAAAAKPEPAEAFAEEPDAEVPEPPAEAPTDELPEPVEEPSPEVPADEPADALPEPAEEPVSEEDPDDELPVPDEAPEDELPVPENPPDEPEASGIVTRRAAVTVPSSAGTTDVPLSQAIFESVVRTLFPLSANAYPSDGVSVTYSSTVLPAENVLPSLIPLKAMSVAV